MRILTLLSALAALFAYKRAAAQPRPPQMRAVADLRIDKTLPTLNRSSVLLVGQSGEMIVAQTQNSGAIRGFDSTGRALPWSIPVGGGRDSEIRWVARMGWAGSMLWAADPGFDQLALIDRAGKLTKSLEYPAWVRPAWADRRKYPVFAGVEPLALYADGSWLVRPSKERSVVSTPDYDKSVAYLMRISENGSVQHVVARVPRDQGRADVRFRSASSNLGPSYAPLTIWDVSPDGARVVVVATSSTGADSATYRVTMLGARGDTVYSRRFPFVPVPLSKQSIDSVRARFNRSAGGRSAEEIANAKVNQLPAFYPPIENLLPGRDQTVWLELRGTASEHTWLVLDATGAAVATVALPKEFIVRVAERDRVWGFERDGDRVTALVRYKLLPVGSPAKR